MDAYSCDRFCPCCDSLLDRFGGHARQCMAAGDTVACHNAVRNYLGRVAQGAGFSPSLEQAHLLPPRPEDNQAANLRRPADIYIPSWKNGAPAALDTAITSPLQQGIVGQAALTSGAAAKAYEERKRAFLNTADLCAQQGILFVPLVAECTGGWGEDSLKALRHLAQAAADRRGREKGEVLTEILQSLCIIIRSAKARAVLRRAPCGNPALGSGGESAGVALQLDAVC